MKKILETGEDILITRFGTFRINEKNELRGRNLMEKRKKK
jgi:nucleoid DNA-binding protein